MNMSCRAIRWNAAHRASNWLLINLQRHSDHHYKPDRRFPLLQTYTEDEAPQLPFGYPMMTTAGDGPAAVAAGDEPAGPGLAAAATIPTSRTGTPTTRR